MVFVNICIFVTINCCKYIVYVTMHVVTITQDAKEYLFGILTIADLILSKFVHIRCT